MTSCKKSSPWSPSSKTPSGRKEEVLASKESLVGYRRRKIAFCALETRPVQVNLLDQLYSGPEFESW